MASSAASRFLSIAIILTILPWKLASSNAFLGPGRDGLKTGQLLPQRLLPHVLAPKSSMFSQCNSLKFFERKASFDLECGGESGLSLRLTLNGCKLLSSYCRMDSQSRATRFTSIM